MAPTALDKRVMAWRSADVADDGLYQVEALGISTLGVANTFEDNRGYAAGFKWHVMEEVRTQVKSQTDLLGTIEPTLIKITDMTIPEPGPSGVASNERKLSITLCHGEPNQNKKLFLPCEAVLLSDRKIKSLEDFDSKSSNLNYAFLLMTPSGNGQERDENGGRMNSNERSADALVGPASTAMWARLQHRIEHDLPDQFWYLTPLVNLATMRRVARALQNIEEGSGSPILDKILDPVPSAWVQPPLCEVTLQACIAALLNTSQAEAVAFVAGALNEVALMSAKRAVHSVALPDPDPTDYYGFNAAPARKLKPSRCMEDMFGSSTSDDEGDSSSSSSGDDDGTGGGDFFSAQSSTAPARKKASNSAKIPREFVSRVLMIQGPPGTGKTKTISQMCILLAHPRNSTCISVCAPSNVAVAEIAKRLLLLVPPYDAPRGDRGFLQQNKPALMSLMVRGGAVRGGVVPDLAALEAFPALFVSRPSSVVPPASAGKLTGRHMRSMTPADSWNALTSQSNIPLECVASTSAGPDSVARPAQACPKPPVLSPCALIQKQKQEQQLLGNGILRRADVVVIGSEERLEASFGLTTTLSSIHVNSRVKSVRKALGPCKTGAGQVLDCSWSFNLTELRFILDDTSTSALDTWSSGAGSLGRTFQAWIHDALHTRYQQLHNALDIFGKHLPTSLMGPGLIPAGERLVETLVQLLRVVKHANAEELHRLFSNPDTNNGGNDSDTSGDASDTAQPAGMRLPAAPAMPPPPPRRFLNRAPLQPTLASLRQDLLQQLLSLPTTLNPDTKAPETNEWKDVEPWLMSGARILLCTVSMAGSFIMRAAPDVDVCIIDEAAQLVEAEACIILDRFSDVKVLVLVGDHKQLPATVISESAKANGYGRSMFERFQALRAPIQVLNTQYRMHPAISIFPRSNFYANTGLMDGENVRAPGYSSSVTSMGLNLHPMSFINVEGVEVQPVGSKSFYNDMEAQVVAKLAKQISTAHKRATRMAQLRGEAPKTLSIGVVTMYSQQVLRITGYLNPAKVENDRGGKHDRAFAWTKDGIEWEVRSVDGFQGRETDVILFSTVRSNKAGSLGAHTSDSRRINVALTRAKHLLVVVGNQKTLTKHPKSDCKFPALIKQARALGSFKEMDQVLPDMA